MPDGKRAFAELGALSWAIREMLMRHATAMAAALVLTSAALGHHSDAGLDMNSVVTLEGTVTEFSWRNPHVYFSVETTDERGQQTEWALQMGSTITVARMGWTRESLSVGERVTVQAHPSHDGRPYALLRSIEKEGGIALPTSFNSISGEPILALPEASARTTTLEGRWVSDTSKLVSYPGGFDGFFRAQLELTEKGRAAQAQYDELSDENPESTCVGRPTPGMILQSDIYPLEIRFHEDKETVVIRSEFFDEERTVYMDGRGHPEASVRTPSGHSTGRWEGDILIVDTRNFSDHRSPYQIGVPSGAAKHVVERYHLMQDGARMVVEFTLEDPEYLAAPLVHTRELIYSPHMEMFRFDCYPESTSRFLPESE